MAALWIHLLTNVGRVLLNFSRYELDNSFEILFHVEEADAHLGLGHSMTGPSYVSQEELFQHFIESAIHLDQLGYEFLASIAANLEASTFGLAIDPFQLGSLAQRVEDEAEIFFKVFLALERLSKMLANAKGPIGVVQSVQN